MLFAQIGIFALYIAFMCVFCCKIYLHRLFLTVAITTVLLYSAVFICICLFFPSLSNLFLIVSGIAFCCFFVLSRPTYGKQKQLPKGSLSLASSIKALHDEYFYQKQSILYGPIFKYSQYYKPVICLVKLSDGIELLKNYSSYLEPCSLPFNDTIDHGFLRYMKIDKHRLYNPIFCKAFHRSIVDRNDDYFYYVFHKKIAQMSEYKCVDIKPHIRDIVFTCFAQLMLGIKDHEKNFSELKSIFQRLPQDFMTKPRSTKTIHVFEEFRQLLIQNFAQEIDCSCVIDILKRAQDLNMQTIHENLMFIFFISVSNVVGLLCWVFEELTTHGECLEKVVDQYSDVTIESFLLEVLRLHQSEYLYRRVNKSFYFRDLQFPKKWMIRICIRECHRDESTFGNANSFYPQRFEKRQWSRKDFAPFGLDHHACVGAYLAKNLAKIFIDELAKTSWTKVEEHKNAQRLRHWTHWQPKHYLVKFSKN